MTNNRIHTSERDGDEEDGKSFTFVCNSLDQREQWLHAFQSAIDSFNARPQQWIVFRIQSHLKAAYACEPFQVTVAGFILANFMCMAAEAQMNPQEGSEAEDAFQKIEYLFTILFCAELAFNMVANLFWDFVCSGWNWFDLFVISTAVVSLTGLIDTGGEACHVEWSGTET